MSKPQHQGSLEDQLDELTSRAAQDGLYDAQDWLVRRRASASGRNNEKLTEAHVQSLCAKGIINQATCNNALRSFRGDNGHVGEHAIRICEVAIEALIERAIDAACAVIQDKLGVKSGDLAATILSDGTLERKLMRYVHAELETAVP